MSNAVKRTEVPRFRSQWNYGPDCPSLTVYGPSDVDSSQYEEVSHLVLKLLRGELRSDITPVFDAEASADPEKVIQEMPVTRSDGFDLSDANLVLKEGKEALRAHEKAVKDKKDQEDKLKAEKAVKDKKDQEDKLKDEKVGKGKPPAATAGGTEAAE